MEDKSAENIAEESNDLLCPLNNTNEILEQLVIEKKCNPSKFVSYWEMDEEDVDEATEEQIQNDPVLRTLWAAEKNKLDVLEEMLTNDPDLIGCKDNDGYSPLHRAGYEDHVQIIKYLLDHGADIESRTNDGLTPLHSACIWGQFAAASILLSHGANINAQTNGKQTALHLAAANSPECREVLELLLMNPDCDFSLKNSVGETAMEIGKRCSKYYHLFEICEDSLNKLC